MVPGMVSTASSLAALAADIAAARAVMAPAVPATVLQQVETAKALEQRYGLERIPFLAEADAEAAARAFNEVTRPHFARSIRPLFDERLALGVLHRQGIQLDALKLTPQIPDAAALGLVTFGIAEGFLAATEGQLNAFIEQGLRIIESAPAPNLWTHPMLIAGLSGITVGITGMALQSHFSLCMAIWAFGALSLACGISRVSEAYAAMRRHMGDALGHLAEEFQAVETAKRRLLELRPEIQKAEAWSADQAVTRLRPPSLER